MAATGRGMDGRLFFDGLVSLLSLLLLVDGCCCGGRDDFERCRQRSVIAGCCCVAWVDVEDVMVVKFYVVLFVLNEGTRDGDGRAGRARAAPCTLYRTFRHMSESLEGCRCAGRAWGPPCIVLDT